jgi:hypothetical protein
MEIVLSVLPFLVFLACPIMMAFCFFRMRRKGGDSPPSTEAEPGFQLSEERIAALQQQLHAIQAEPTTLQGLEAQAPPVPAGGMRNQLVDVIPGAARATRSPA